MHLLARDYGHRYIFFHGEWEPLTTRFLKSISTPGWAFIDVGANAGYYSILARDLGGPTASIHAFEPNPELYRLLTLSVQEIGGVAIRVLSAACGAESGTADLFLSPVAGNSGLSTLREGHLPEAASVAVTVVTLDAYCLDAGLQPDVIKIDVEGMELPVLLGAKRLLAHQVPRYLICELEPDRAQFEPLDDYLTSYGYRARSIAHDGGLIPYRPSGHQNLVFVRADEDAW